jgi:hypothetical protein
MEITHNLLLDSIDLFAQGGCSAEHRDQISRAIFALPLCFPRPWFLVAIVMVLWIMSELR